MSQQCGVRTRSQAKFDVKPDLEEEASSSYVSPQKSPKKRSLHVITCNDFEECSEASEKPRCRKRIRFIASSEEETPLPDSEDYREDQYSISTIFPSTSESQGSLDHFSSADPELELSAEIKQLNEDQLDSEAEILTDDSISQIFEDSESADISCYNSSQSSEMNDQKFSRIVARSEYVDKSKERVAVPRDSVRAMDYIRLWTQVEAAINANNKIEALELLVYQTSLTKKTAQVFTEDRMNRSAFLDRLAYGWRVFIRKYGSRLSVNDQVQILRTLCNDDVEPFIKVVTSMWKYVFKPDAKVSKMPIEDLLKMVEKGASINLPSQVEYLWAAKRLREHNRRFESMILCCAMGQYYKYRFSSSRLKYIESWENALHQRYVTHLLTLATRPEEPLTDSSLKTTKMWSLVSKVARDPKETITDDLKNKVSQDFVTYFVLYYTICYTDHMHFNALLRKYRKFSRIMRFDFPLNKALDCILNPTVPAFIDLAANGHEWLQETVFERFLFIENVKRRIRAIFPILSYKGLWDFALSSLVNATEQDYGSDILFSKCEYMVDHVPSLVKLSMEARHMYIEMIERQIRSVEGLSNSIKKGLKVIGEVTKPIEAYLRALGRAYKAFTKVGKEDLSTENLRLIRRHLFMLQKKRDWTQIIDTVIRHCKPKELARFKLMKKERGPEDDDDEEPEFWIHRVQKGEISPDMSSEEEECSNPSAEEDEFNIFSISSVSSVDLWE